MQKLSLYIFIISIFFASCLKAFADSNLYYFLNIPCSAHAFALGGVNISLIDEDASLATQNPALVGPEIERQATFGYMRHLFSENYASAFLALKTSQYSALTTGIRYLNYGSFDGYLPDGTPTTNFNPIDIAFDISYSHDITSSLRGGITTRLILNQYEQYNALAFGVDLGLNYYNSEKELSASLLLANMGGQLKRLDYHHSPLPFDIRLGATKSISDTPIEVSVTATGLTRWQQPYYNHNQQVNDVTIADNNFLSNLFRHLIFGIQYSENKNFYLAAGYNYRQRTDLETFQRNLLSGFTTGFGFHLKDVGLNLAFGMPTKSTTALNLNLNFNF